MNGHSQNHRIAQYLCRSGKSLTPYGALRMFGTMRLAARAYDLRQAGIGLRCKRVTRNGKTFASYSWP
jgi:hypothetical protein